jgi:hypothetical protein
LAFNDAYWAGIVRPGDWNISAATTLFKSSGAPYFHSTLEAYKDNPSFNITPEPISCALFLLGGGALAVAGKLRRRA